MKDPTLTQLAGEISALGLLEDVTVADETLRGTGTLAATESRVLVTVDPELEEESRVDGEALVASLQGILAIPASTWSRLIDEIATEIEEAVSDTAIREQTDLRTDLDVVAITVFADASLFEFAAPRQFPTARLHAQVNAELELEDIEVVAAE
jgi:hypothetical protein